VPARKISEPLLRGSLMQVNPHAASVIKIPLSCDKQKFNDVRRYCPLGTSALRVSA
jgi:hypothetical protein